MDKATKTTTILEYATKAGDTGSSEVQIAVLSARIKELTEHLKLHPKDVHSRRGMMALITRRRKLMEYLKATTPARYESVRDRLGLRH